MGLTNEFIDISKFISLTNSGLKVASFVQVKDAIIRRYKETYGEDIDVSTATADGVFINDVCLIINNILQTISTIYSNLDVNTASGMYLDILCRLSNVERRAPTKSKAYLKITNTGDADLEIPLLEEFFDKAGNTWQSLDNVTLAPDEARIITVEAETEGEVEAPAGYITNFVDAGKIATVEQEQRAIPGLSVETDSELRDRRAQSNGAMGVTVLESLYGALRNNPAIIDAKIYNATSEDITALDGVTVPAHSVYIVIRKSPGITVDDNTIGDLIYDKLTPGITTVDLHTATVQTVKQYIVTFPELGADDEFKQTLYWKECVPQHTSFTVTIKPLIAFDGNLTETATAADWKTGTFELIAKALIDYMNGLGIGFAPTAFDIQSVTAEADPLFKAKPTFLFDSTSITTPTNPDTYYDYSEYSVARGADGKYIITIGE